MTRGVPGWAAAVAVLAGVVAGMAGGWFLRGIDVPAPGGPAAPAAAQPTQPPGMLWADQARTQTCGSYKALGLQWSAAYQRWIAALPQPWSWNDPAVKTATADFDATQTQVATQLVQLTAPNTPADVADTVRAVRVAIVDLAASHGQTATGAETDAKVDRVDAAMAAANKACGLA